MCDLSPISVIWDFDGTLVDTSRKNLNVTREILRAIRPDKTPEDLPALSNLEHYLKASRETVNWRDFYQLHFGLNLEETDLAGKLWTEYQLKDESEITFFPGIIRVLKKLQYLPHAIVSQNSRDNIIKLLTHAGVQNYFSEIIGYEEVDIKLQKPYPDGLMKCIEQTTRQKQGIVYYIGDHETDVACAYNADKLLKGSGIRVMSIAAFYRYELNTADWNIKPDHIALKESEIFEIISRG